MANKKHLAKLKEGVEAWNQWRKAYPKTRPNLVRADLAEADLREADLYEADLFRADLTEANLTRAVLVDADLTEAKLHEADLTQAVLDGTNLTKAGLYEATLDEANLTRANLTGANLTGAYLGWAALPEADLTQAVLDGANLMEADLSGANLHEAALMKANLTGADLTGADLSGADLTGAHLQETILEKANLTGCRVYAASSWDVNLVGAQQSNLIITPEGKPVITVDNLEVAQFIYLLLHNEKIRAVIDTITSKAVLILGRFTPERKAILDAIREALRQRNYLPILFDFEAPRSRDFTETISTLAHMARFIIADLTEPSSLPKELEAIVPTLAVPVQPVLEGATHPYSIFQDYWKYHWVLKVYRYEGLEGLIAALRDRVIAPADVKVQELEEARKAIAEELLKQRPS